MTVPTELAQSAPPFNGKVGAEFLSAVVQKERFFPEGLIDVDSRPFSSPGYLHILIWMILLQRKFDFLLRLQSHVMQALLLALIMPLLFGCGLLKPLPAPSNFNQRMQAFPQAGLPLQGKVDLYWDRYQIPFIDAQHDIDAAFMLGMIHAHLRLGQLEIFRRISQGRISEMAGPFTVDLDHAIRILNFGKAVPEIINALPEQTRSWLEAFLKGLNHYQQTVDELPAEFRMLDMKRELWTLYDLLTLLRLYSADVNWLIWLSAIRMSEQPGFESFWQTFSADTSSDPSFRLSRDRLADFDQILANLSKSGSNSIVFSSAHTSNGSALIASDPHLGISYPNIWLLAGYRSPSYHVVGLMLPGAPFVALGRNTEIAWGGTNMRGMSSSVYDLSNQDQSQLRSRQERIVTRLWPDRSVSIRESAFGPVLSDAKFFKEKQVRPFALRWLGHQPSDETGAFLAMNRARDFEQFKAAFSDYSVSSQNFLYADKRGNIGQVLAMRRPVYDSAIQPKLFLSPDAAEDDWKNLLSCKDLPSSFNPEPGYIASANNRPVNISYPLGYFYSDNNRIRRLKQLADAKPLITVSDLEQLQVDTYSESSFEITQLLLQKIPEQYEQNPLFIALRDWNGHYEYASRGALAFELLMASLVPALFEQQYNNQDFQSAMLRGVRWKPEFKKLLGEDFKKVLDLLDPALEQASKHFARYLNWGEKHRVSVAHPLSRVPLIGSRFRFLEFPASGSSDTLLKAAHGLTVDPTFASYGANARHISDLSQLDENYFVLLGGQDGWLGSDSGLDQSMLWQRGKYIRVPLSIEAIKKNAKLHMSLP